MIDENAKVSRVQGKEKGKPGVSGDFAAPLGAATSGRLVFASGAADVHIEGNAPALELYRARFDQHIPSVRVQEGVVTIQYRRYLLLDWLNFGREPLARVMLNGTIAWEIEFRDAVSHLNADLRNLQVSALDLGSVSTALLNLPVPCGSANVYLSGSASDVTIHYPAGVALRLYIGGSASHLTLEGQHIGAIGAGLNWQNKSVQDASSRYDISIAGSVSNLTIAMI